MISHSNAYLKIAKVKIKNGEVEELKEDDIKSLILSVLNNINEN